MPRLQDITSVLRSKNAGPFQITIDLIFDDLEKFYRVLDSCALDPVKLAQIYGTLPTFVQVTPFELVRAIKITVPRRWGSLGSGSAGDRDVYGALQHGPLADIEVP